ncbi:MAG: Ig-like domain-containing protein [Bacteroidales bacterium]|nr:Ig-like domain-containing protein [Bacteroidales bacterium]
MKRFIILTVLAIGLLLSCTERFEESYPDLRIDQTEYPLDLAGGRFMVYVYYDGAWTMTLPEDVTWARIENGSGKGTGHAYISYDMGVPTERSATVTVTADNGQTASFAINQGKRIIVSESISLDRTEVVMVHDEEVILQASVLPAETTYPEVKWTSSDEGVVTVDNGRIIVHGPGQAVITASNGGNEAWCTVFVSAPLRGLSLNADSISLYEGGIWLLTPVFNPVFAENREVSWSSSDESIATVENGLVKALKLGEAVITATAADGGYTAECKVTVQESTIIDVPDFGGDSEGFKDDDYIWEN